MSTELILTNFLIDTVQSAGEDKVVMKTYAVLGSSADEAFRRFMQDQAGTIVYEGEPVEAIVVGMQLANEAAQPVDADSWEIKGEIES